MDNVDLKQQADKWSELPWKKFEKVLYKLQKRIYQASLRGDVTNVKRLQKLLIKSRSAKFIAVRRVTQDNQGRKTAGVDGVKSLSPKQRLALVDKITLSSKVFPVRRVWIPKPGKDEKAMQRGLGGFPHERLHQEETFRHTYNVRPRIAMSRQTGFRTRMGGKV